MMRGDFRTWEDSLKKKILAGWGLGRLFRWAKPRTWPLGETVLVGNLLNLASEVQVGYADQTVMRVLHNDVEENVPAHARDYLRSLNYNAHTHMRKQNLSQELGLDEEQGQHVLQDQRVDSESVSSIPAKGKEAGKERES